MMIAMLKKLAGVEAPPVVEPPKPWPSALNPEITKQMLPPLAFAAGTDLRLKGTTDTDNSVMRGSMDILVVAD